MKAVRPRIERLYADEAERWRARWKQFNDTLWSHLTYDEQRAYADLYSPDQRGEHDEAVEAMMERWLHELREQFHEGEPSDPKRIEEGVAFIVAFFDVLPKDGDAVDLSRWPEDVPYPPDEDEDLARREEDALVALCRREKGKGEIERLTAGHLIMHVAICRTARRYGRKPSYRTPGSKRP